MDMHHPGTGLVRKDSIEELCGHRDRAITLYAQVLDTLAEAKKAHARACIGNAYIHPPGMERLDYRQPVDFMAEARENIDRDMWRAFLVNTPLGSLMDVKERKEFEEALRKPAECTPETVFATMDRLRSESGAIFRRGLVNAFAALSREYKSHDGFKVGPRMVLEYVVSAEKWGNGTKWWVRFTTYAEERLRDLDRVFHVLDGQPAPEYQQGLCAAMRTAMGMEVQAWQTETPYFRVKWFKNGNAHLHFLRDDLVLKANRLIAEHYGAVVGAASHVAEKGASPNAPPADPCLTDFFETPRDLAARMVAEAGVEAWHKILEPSAGEGAIIRALQEHMSETCLTMYEAHHDRSQTLRTGWPLAKVDCVNFLAVTPKPVYDRILMNPPFSRGLDVLHVEHAIKCLAPGGRLVAIMAAGILGRSDAPTVRLRTQLERLGGMFERLPEGTFKAAGTGVNTVLVVVDAP